MREFIYPEMMVHVGMCTSKTAQNILIVSDDAENLSAEAKKHSESDVKVVSANLESLSALADSAYDVVINELKIDGAVASQINRILKDDAQLVTTHPSLDDVEANTIMMKILGQYFKIIMPFNLGNCQTALLASKEYHPTADINLHRADMLDGVEYYNCDVHVGAFAMGNDIRKTYLGIIKN
jgi:spermidine synthase